MVVEGLEDPIQEQSLPKACLFNNPLPHERKKGLCFT